MNRYIIKPYAIWNDEGEQETVFQILDGDTFEPIFDMADSETAERYYQANAVDARCEA